MSAPAGSEFAGRIALVTGGSIGIGRAICLRLAEGGARVVINFRSREGEAAELAHTIAKSGGIAMTAKADVADPSQMASLRSRVEAEMGPVTLLVNNAGHFAADPEDGSGAHLEQTLRANLMTTYAATHCMKNSMLEQGFGRIVNIASTAGRRVPVHAVSYAAAKAGVVAMTEGWAQAWGSLNIRVNCVAPGFIDTASNAHADALILKKIVEATPQGRPGRPEEPADVVAFLLSEASSFVNGQTITVCGGRITGH